MVENRPENPKSWRDNWLVKNILVELPIVGSFFSKKKLSDAVHEAGKCTAMLIGGTSAMMSILTSTEDDAPATKIAKTTTSMAFGMWAGKTAYNTISSGGEALYGKMVYYYQSKTKSAVPRPESDLTELLSTRRLSESSDVGTNDPKPYNQLPTF